MDVDVVKALNATKEYEKASLAVIVTSSTLEPVARDWAARLGVEVIEGPKLVALFSEYCDPEQPAYPPNSPSMEHSGETSSPNQHLEMLGLDNESDRKILDLVAEKKRVQNLDVQRLFNISRQAAGVRLKKLVQHGHLRMQGQKQLRIIRSRIRTCLTEFVNEHVVLSPLFNGVKACITGNNVALQTTRYSPR